MKYIALLIIVILFGSCENKKEGLKPIIFSGKTTTDVNYLIIDNDTLKIENGTFVDTITIHENFYGYVQLNTWKLPKMIYLDRNKNLSIDFSQTTIKAQDDNLNNFILNSDSILIPYSLRWDMDDVVFRNTIDTELNINFDIMDSVLIESGINNELITELKSVEKLKVAHRTANFISFQERKGNSIDRSIYDFLSDVNLNNKRFENQINNRNFQYYYLLDKVSDEVPDSIYPFAVIDTVNKYSTINSIRKMIISSTLKSSFYMEDVDHDKMISRYEDNFEKLDRDGELFKLKEKIQLLKPGNQAPSIGELVNVNGELKTIEDLRGANILLTVWGTWCPYCKEELPALKTLIEKYGDKFTNVGISFDKDKDKWKAYIKENNWKGIHLNDSKRRSDFKSNYLINGTNVHLLIDKEGTIVSSKTLKPSSKELEELIKTLK